MNTLVTHAQTQSRRIVAAAVSAALLAIAAPVAAQAADTTPLAQDGFVVINMLVNRGGGLVGKPEIISRGFAFVRDSDEMFSAAQAHIAATVSRAAAGANGAPVSPQALREKVQSGLADFFYANLKRRPMIFAFVNEL